MKYVTHGLSRTPVYRAYIEAKARCSKDSKNKYFRLWGSRGIEFRFSSFEEWFKELGHRPSNKHSVDRENNDGHYEPGNVRWALRETQLRNRRKYAHRKRTGKGYEYDSNLGKWRSRFCFNGVRYDLGYFLTKEEAAEVSATKLNKLLEEYEFHCRPAESGEKADCSSTG